METQISLTSVNRGRNLEHSNYLVNTEPPLNQHDKPTGSLATRDKHGWMSSSLTHTQPLCSLQVWQVLKVLSASKPNFPAVKPRPPHRAEKQKSNTFGCGCTKPSADQMFSSSTRCGLHNIFSLRLPISNTSSLNNFGLLSNSQGSSSSGGVISRLLCCWGGWGWGGGPGPTGQDPDAPSESLKHVWSYFPHKLCCHKTALLTSV